MEKKEIEIVKEALRKKYFEIVVDELGDKKFFINNQGVVSYRAISQDPSIFYLETIQKLFEALAEEKANRWLSENLKETSS